MSRRKTCGVELVSWWHSRASQPKRLTRPSLEGELMAKSTVAPWAKSPAKTTVQQVEPSVN